MCEEEIKHKYNVIKRCICNKFQLEVGMIMNINEDRFSDLINSGNVEKI